MTKAELGVIRLKTMAKVAGEDENERRIFEKSCGLENYVCKIWRI
jgi:hypothetical protein